jgi:hypothetical protein
MLHEIKNIELRELSKIENFDRITLLVCKNNKLIDLQKILLFKNNNDNFLSLEYSSSEVNKKLLSICEKYEKQFSSIESDFTFIKEENTCQINTQTIPNYSIETLARIENLDSITHFICKQFKLLDLKCMLDYYRTYGSFILLDSSNPQVNKKLTSICEKYKRQNENSFNELIEKNGHAQQENSQLIPNYSIEKLAEIEKLAVRSYNACRYYKLLTLSDLLDYYKENGHFLNVKNCGRKSNDELVTICKKYTNIKFGESMFSDYKEDETIDDIQNYTLQQLASKEKLSVRVQNVCESNGLLNLSQILDYYYKHVNFKKLRNCGSNSSSELIILCEKYKNLLSPSTSEIKRKI